MRKVGDRVEAGGLAFEAIPERAHGMCFGCDVFQIAAVGPCGQGCFGSGTILRRVETETEKPMNETEAKPAPTAAPAWELRIQTPCSVQELAEMLRAFAVPRTVTVEGSVIVVRP